MKNYLIVILFFGLFTSCEKPKGYENPEGTKNVLDSLATTKKNKQEEIFKLNSELDSLKRISDSLKAME